MTKLHLASLKKTLKDILWIDTNPFIVEKEKIVKETDFEIVNNFGETL